MSSSSADPPRLESDRALALVHEGWNHLRLQRPQAAWACWQRALRVDPDSSAAREALARLEAADDLPAAARAVYRFEPPAGPLARDRWNLVIGQRDLEDLDDAADAFGRLASEDPADAPAWYNRALCLAWLGRNTEAISCLDRVVRLWASDRSERAEGAWALAETLRQGGGAEMLADDLRYLWDMPWTDADTTSLHAAVPTLKAMPAPRDPLTGDLQFPGSQIFEWLDRAPPDPAASLGAEDVPRVLATVVVTPRSLRLSSPDPESLEQLRDSVGWIFDDPSRPITREAVPLPLPLLDAAIWTFRPPPGLEPETEGRVAREAVEHYYEDVWIHRPRRGLEGLAPLEASRRAMAGDTAAQARLQAGVRVREQLGARSRTVALYQGYPFDRLRRRLGLPLEDPAVVDPADASCMSEQELDRLDPNQLGDDAVADAYRSAAGLRDDRRTAQFAARLVQIASPAIAHQVTADVFAVLVREAMRAHDPNQALDWLAIARQSHPMVDGRTCGIWSAEIHARSGNPDAAVDIYRSMLDESRLDTPLLIDAAEDLLTNGHSEHAAALLELAAQQAEREQDHRSLARIRRILDVDDAGPAPT